MPKYCGDEAKLEYEVEAPLIGEFAMISIQRFDRKSLTAYGFQEITAKKTEMKWPDQEVVNGKGYYGGRQVDFKGLNKKKYADRYAKQNFILSVQHADQCVESSNTEIIDELPVAAREPRVEGIPMAAEVWRRLPTGVYQMHQALSATTYATLAAKRFNAGRFDIEHKEGVIIITIKIHLVSDPPGKNTSRVFKDLKKKVEAFWNSDAQGFNQWIYHRIGCERKEKCNCSVVPGKNWGYKTAGCCKVPFKVVIEKGGAGDNVVNITFLDPGKRKEARANRRATRGGTVQLPQTHPNYWGAHFAANTYTLSYPENRAGTYAHEIGHMMGFPDQYATGVVAAGAMSATGRVNGVNWDIDDASVMGSSQNRAMKIHLEATWFNEWINSKIDKMAVIDKL